MNISLVVATMNRPGLLRRLLVSLSDQTRLPDQVVVVDQSVGVESEAECSAFKNRLNINYVRAEARGAAAARNVGMTFVNASTSIIGFPDDDCWYPPDAVSRVMGEFEASPKIEIFSGISYNDKGVPSQGRWAKKRVIVDRYNAWITQTQYTTFYRASVFGRLGHFREELGTGAPTPWGSGEETEFMIRAVSSGCHAEYDPGFYIFHPEPLAVFDDATYSRGRKYNMGFGRVMRIADYPLWFVLYMSTRPLVGAALSAIKGNFGRARYQLIASYFRFKGWTYPV